MDKMQLQQLKKIIKEWNTDPVIQHEEPVELYITMFKQSIERALIEGTDETLERVKRNLEHYRERIIEKKRILKSEYKVQSIRNKIQIIKHG